MSTFKSVVTDLGQARIATAIESGQDINITQMAVGDGGGKATVPVSTQTRLVKETYRIKLNSLKTDSKHANWVIAEAIIPASAGGFWMREMGLYADDGTLIAVCNMAETYKPALEEGSGRTQTLRMVITVTSTDAVSLTIDDSLIVATEEYVNDLLAAHEKSRNHPDGTLTAKGFVQLSSAVNSASEVLAATPKAVKTANDNANGRLPSGGTAVASTKLATARKIAGVAFDGTADISIPPANVGALPATGTAAAATKLATPRKIAGVAFDGMADISIAAGNVGAVPTAGGDVGYLANSARYSIKPGVWEGLGALAAQYTNPKSPFLIPFGLAAPAGVSNYLPIIKGLTHTQTHGYGAAVSFGALTSGNPDYARACIHVIGDNGKTAVWIFDPNTNGLACPGDINGADIYGSKFSAGYLVANKVAYLDRSQGTYIGWNESGSRGESNFINNRGNGPGGFVFRTINIDNTVQTGQVIFSGTGDLSTSGTITEAGQRVYSPNNKPTPEAVNSIQRDTCNVAGFVSGSVSAPYMRHSTSNAVVTLATNQWTNASFVGDIRLGASSEFQERGNNERMGGGVMTSFKDAGSSNYWIRLRPLQKLINGNWYTVGYA